MTITALPKVGDSFTIEPDLWMFWNSKKPGSFGIIYGTASLHFKSIPTI
jgi:hypothetical protein